MPGMAEIQKSVSVALSEIQKCSEELEAKSKNAWACFLLVLFYFELYIINFYNADIMGCHGIDFPL